MLVRFNLISLINMASCRLSFLVETGRFDRFVAGFRLLISMATCRLWQHAACGKLSLVASCRLWQVVACGKLSLVASCRLWQVVACGKLSLVASCRLWQVVACGKLSLASCRLWQVVALWYLKAHWLCHQFFREEKYRRLKKDQLTTLESEKLTFDFISRSCSWRTKIDIEFTIADFCGRSAR